MGEKQPRRPSVRRVIRIILTVLCFAALAAVFFVMAILIDPQEEDPVRNAAPLASPGPSQTLRSEDELDLLLDAFPAPVLMAAPNGDLSLTAGHMEDVAVSGGYARVLTLVYRSSGGTEITVRSIWPAGADGALEREGWRISGIAGQSVAGMESIRLEKADRLRLQCRGTAALYTVETDPAAGDALAALLRPLQLTAE